MFTSLMRALPQHTDTTTHQELPDNSIAPRPLLTSPTDQGQMLAPAGSSLIELSFTPMPSPPLTRRALANCIDISTSLLLDDERPTSPISLTDQDRVLDLSAHDMDRPAGAPAPLHLDSPIACHALLVLSMPENYSETLLPSYPCLNTTWVENSSPNRSIANQLALASDSTLTPIATPVDTVYITAAPVFDKHLYNSKLSCS